jgi:hypothetical protein
MLYKDLSAYNALSYYLVLVRFLFLFKNNNISLLFYINHKTTLPFQEKFNTKIRFFKDLFKSKKFYIFQKERINFSKLDLQTTQKSILFFKRRFGALKHSFKPKKYNLHKANFFLNLRNEQESSQNKSVVLLRFKKMKKMFFKINRKHILPKFETMRQFKKNPRIYARFSKMSSESYDLSLSSFLVRQKIFLTKHDFVSYIRINGYIYNGKVFKNQDVFLRENDVIQFPFSHTLFLPMFKKQVDFKKYLVKIKPQLFKMMRNRFDINKQSTTHIPKWALKFTLFQEMKATNVEFEFSTMTFIVIKNNVNFFYLANNFDINLSYYLNRLYNWKYIT